MRVLRLLSQRSRLLQDARWETDSGTGDASSAGRRLQRNAEALGLARLPAWFLLIHDGALRGWRAYHTFSPSYGWFIWPLLALLTAGCLVAYFRGSGAEYLFGATIGPLVVVFSAAAGILYDLGRTILGGSIAARIIAAGTSGGILAGVLAIPFTFDTDGTWSMRGTLAGAAMGFAFGVLLEVATIAAYRSLRPRSGRGAT